MVSVFSDMPDTGRGEVHVVRNLCFTTWTKAFWSSALLVIVLAMTVVLGMKLTFTRRWWSQSGPDRHWVINTLYLPLLLGIPAPSLHTLLSLGTLRL